MAQLYPNNMRDMTLNMISNAGGLNTPPEEDFNTPAMQGSMQQVLSENLGQYVVVEFLIGTQTVESKRGILYAVGRSFLTLFEETSQTFVVCDIFSVKFITFYLPGRRPQRMPMEGTTTGPLYPEYQPQTGPGGGLTLSGIPSPNYNDSPYDPTNTGMR